MSNDLTVDNRNQSEITSYQDDRIAALQRRVKELEEENKQDRVKELTLRVKELEEENKRLEKEKYLLTIELQKQPKNRDLGPPRIRA